MNSLRAVGPTRALSHWLVILAGCLMSACSSVNQVPAANSHAADIQRRVDIRLELASAYFADGKTAYALEEIDRALQLQPQHAEALGLRGLVLLQAGDSAAAISHLRQAVRIEPDNPGLLNNLGWALCQSGKPQTAMPYLERALAQPAYAESAKAWVNAGLCRMKAGDPKGAEIMLLRGLMHEPHSVQARAGLAQLEFERGNSRQAQQYLLQVLASEQVTAEHFALAVRIERQLGDRQSEQSLLSQWQRRFPQSPQLQVYLSGASDAR